MKVCGFTIIRNAVKLDYPVVEAIRSVLPVCDEMVVAVGHSDDNTLEVIRSIDPKKVRVVETVWDDGQREGGRVLALETDKAFAAIPPDADWCFYIQADEVLHEKYLPAVREAMERNLSDPDVEGLLFNYLHFYGSFARASPPRAGFVVARQLGRVAAYTLAGAAMGGLGQALLFVGQSGALRLALQLLFALSWLWLAARLLKPGLRLPWASDLGARLWTRLQPLTRSFLPASTPPRAFALGALWGFMPCGLSYAMLMIAATQGSALGGAAIMAAFGVASTFALGALDLGARRVDQVQLRRGCAVPAPPSRWRWRRSACGFLTNIAATRTTSRCRWHSRATTTA